MSLPQIEQTDENDSNPLTIPPSDGKSFRLWDGIKTGLIFLLVQIVVSIPVSVIGIGVAMAMGKSQEVGMQYAMGATLALSFPVAVWFLLRKHTLGTNAWQWEGKDVKLLVVSILLMFGVSYVVGGLLEYAPGYEAMFKSYEAMFDGIPPIVLLIAGGFIGPICEEIIFRGIVLKGFLRSYSPQKAIVYSALIFGVIHFIPIQVISAFFAGLVLGYIYYKTKSLWLPIVIHILNNVLAFTLGLEEGSSDTRSYFDNEMIYLASFAAALLVAFIAYKTFEHINGPARHQESEVASIW